MAVSKIRDFANGSSILSKSTGPNGVPPRPRRPDRNQTIFQGFEWYLAGFTVRHYRERALPKEEIITHWRHLKKLLPQICELGFTSVWIPPACKATGPTDNGYGIYDLYDLGEFEAKGTIGTKWGTKEELQILCAEAQRLDIGILFDAVLNHKAAADRCEEALAIRVSQKDRTDPIDHYPRIIESWTQFDFASRQDQYSRLKYNKDHFSGVDWDSRTEEHAIFKFVGKRSDGSQKDWAHDVAGAENGNYDYLMFADVDYGHVDVREDVKRWGCWLIDQLPGMTGFRLDAIKHYSASFQREFMDHVQNYAASKGRKLFFVGEFWQANSKGLSKLIDTTFAGQMNLFDVQLLYNLHDISKGRIRDIRRVFHDTLVQHKPERAVTFVSNHDTQEMQSLAAPVEPWFIPHAYALILLRKAGQPCVFWGDIFGNDGPSPRLPPCGGRLIRLVKARELFAYGDQTEYYSEIGTRSVTPKHDAELLTWLRTWHSPAHGRIGLVVLVSISHGWRKKRVNVGPECAGQIWTDIMGWAWSGVEINKSGIGDFPVGPRSISVWTWKDAPGRNEVDHLVWPEEVPMSYDPPPTNGVVVDVLGQAKTGGI